MTNPNFDPIDFEPPEFDLTDTNVLIELTAAEEVEKDGLPASRQMQRNDIEFETRKIARVEAAGLALGGRLPAYRQAWHYISDARYDYWNIIVEAVKVAGGAVEFYGSTWTMNRNNVLELMQLFDEGLIKKFSILTGKYFKNRETAVYTQLLHGIAKRGQRYAAFVNHTKIALIQNNDYYIVMEGSANFTANPRLENFIIVNNKELYNFHREWMEEMLTKKAIV